MSDNDNEEMVSFDELRNERLAAMPSSMQLTAREKQADSAARLMAAAWIRHIRKRAGIERGELARRLSISDRSLALLELGESVEAPTIAFVMLAADLCGLHFIGNIKTEAELPTKLVLSPEFVQKYRELSKI